MSTHIRFTGTQINYYFVCKRKLWLFSNHIEMERESDAVLIGKLLHEASYQRQTKEIVIDDTIKIDFLDGKGVIHEVKKSDKLEKPHEYQLLYYLYYLKQKG
ncbi:MAG TPA: Dna2/Cas4 domain-containing protein, partial [Candidatus Brocadiales bacterium]|nr:Dna2/Cas4 domain-containing protein [Candidatus Brocadiales bacterium]